MGGALIGFKAGSSPFGLAVVVVAVFTAIANPGTVGIAGESDSAAIALVGGSTILRRRSDSGCTDLDEVTMENQWLGTWRFGRRRRHPAGFWLALVQIKLIENSVLLAIMATVWLADIAAYFSGASFGRRFAPSGISPGKTWKARLRCVGGCGRMDSLFVGFAEEPAGSPALLPCFWLLLRAFSIVGDLLESLPKRQSRAEAIAADFFLARGGAFDRIDSLTSTR